MSSLYVVIEALIQEFNSTMQYKSRYSIVLKISHKYK